MFFESILLNAVTIIILLVALTFDYVTKFFSYWYIRHIPYKTPVPFFGSDYHRVLGIRNSTSEVEQHYKKYLDEKFVGLHRSRIPDVIVKDLESIKTIMSTEFESFTSRGLSLDRSRDVCLKNNLFYAENKKWVSLRKAFEGLLQNLPFNYKSIEDFPVIQGEVNIQDFLSNILDSVFADLLIADKENGSDIVRRLRAEFQKRTMVEKFKSYLKNIFPSLYIVFGVTSIAPAPEYNMEKSRLMKAISLIKSELEVENVKNKVTLKDSDLVFSFLLSFISEGFLPCQYLLTSLLFELARHPEVQQNARLNSMKDKKNYIDKVINETIRLHPPYAVIQRKCVQTFKFPESSLLFDRNVTVQIPVESIQKDDKYYKEADVFNPDRYGNNRESEPYLSFGLGPRKCVGEQLSKQIIRNVTCGILQKYHIEPTRTTPTQLPVVDHNFQRFINGEVCLRLTPITS